MGCCCTCPRHLVSKKKIRTIADSGDDAPAGGVDLDFTLIHRRIACMGFPAHGFESFYRNPYEDVLEYLDFRFPDKYMVYNLCSEPQHQYGAEKFHGRVANFPFPDHHASPLEMIPRFIDHAMAFFEGDHDRVAVIHCKAGKGRTGLFACCLLMKLDPSLSTAHAAIEYYGKARTLDGKGLTIPSQKRYVEYYEQLRLLSNGNMPLHVPKLSISLITLRSCVASVKASVITWQMANAPPLTIFLSEQEESKNASGVTIIRTGKDDVTIDVSRCKNLEEVRGDIRINFLTSAGEQHWVGALSVHALFLKRKYGKSEIDKIYKRADVSEDACVEFEFLQEVS